MEDGGTDDVADDGGIEPDSWHQGGAGSDLVDHSASESDPLGEDDDGTESDRVVADDDDGGGDGGKPDLIDLIGQGRFMAASKLTARQLGVVGPARSARLGLRHTLVGAANAVERRHRPLQLVAAAAASVAATAAFAAIFVLTTLVEGEVPGTTTSVTAWSAGMRVSDGGSYGLILYVLAPALLAAALVADRWWRPILVAVTVYSVHWIGAIRDLWSADVPAEYAAFMWHLRGLLALAVALVLGCLLVVTGRPEVDGRGPRRAEVASAVAALLFLSLTWGRPQMVYEYQDGTQSEVGGMLTGWPLRDLGAVAEYPAEYAARYLPVLLLVVATAAMLTRPGRGRPGVRCGVWLGLAAGAVADAVQRLPLWYDPEPGFFYGYGTSVGEGGRWSPGLAAFALLVGSAVAAVTAGWLAWQQIDATPAAPAPDEPPEVSTAAT